MRALKLVFLGIAITTSSACICADTVGQTRFACHVSAACLPDQVCRGGECRSEVIPEGACFPGERQPCALASCDRPCGSDGGWAACVPVSGAEFESDPLNCAECGRRCSARLGTSLSCIGGRCTCTNDLDCPSGDVCLPGGVCAMNTDPCAQVNCPAGNVCRAGACGRVSCADGCNPGEVCDVGSLECRLILPCRFAEPCPDGGICEGQPQPDGEPCNDGQGCTFGDTCAAGSCNGIGYSCPAPTQCQQAVACAGDGGCEITPVADGRPCDDGVSCTHGDQCVSGACGGSTYTCTPNQCAASSVCAGDGGCEVTPRNVGTGCDDGQSCTFSDVCGDAGLCEGSLYFCPGVTPCKEAGVCLGDGGCDVVNKADSTPCDDGLACNVSDTCVSGTCIGTPITSFRDQDNDGSGNAAETLMACPLVLGYVLDGGDCNDSSGFVQETRPAAPDVDQDGVTLTTTLNPTACVGAATSVVGGRTYYRGATGSYTWLASPSATADCNDADGDIHTNRNVATDADNDSFTTTTTTTLSCTGNSSVVNGRTYYRNASNALTWIATASNVVDCVDTDPLVFPQTHYLDADGDGRGAAMPSQVQCPRLAGWVSNNTDCNDTNGNLFQTRTTVVRDDDRDGYPSSVSDSTQCAGATSSVGTRTYYSDGAGGYWMARSDCIQKTGSNCSGSFVDCYDLNAAANYTQSAYFTVHRGDGSFDYNCSAVIGASVTATYCTSTTTGVTEFTDGTCATPTTGTVTICSSPTVFATPGACGKNTAGATTFTLPGAVCTVETLATSTVIGCR